MRKLICIVGQTCSGKDSLVQKLIENHPDKFKAVCSYTDRPKRDNETEGVEHQFLTYEEFNKLIEEHELIAYTEISGRRYAATKDQLEYSNIYIIDPLGIKYLRENCKDIDIYEVFILAPVEDMIDRSKTSRSDYYTSFAARLESEKDQFDDYKENAEYDLLIYNENGLFDKAYNTLEEKLLEIIE